MWVGYILLLCLDRALLVTQRALLERPLSLMQQGLHVNRPVGLVTLVLPSPDQVRKTILMDWLADASLRWHYVHVKLNCVPPSLVQPNANAAVCSIVDLPQSGCIAQSELYQLVP